MNPLHFVLTFDVSPALAALVEGVSHASRAIGAERRLTRLIEVRMSQIDDKIAKLNSGLDNAVARINEDIASLRATIEAGNATPEQVAALDALQARIDAIDPDPANPPLVPPDEQPTV